ncbi:hypothetical protein CFC21_094744 [Triticum aestivum]|uniref:F-box domain-containing protein n=5 Tax=Triticinae TaxID=1648030 RepID=A0A453Q504_AEGTS|nr:uncharacterized protein LOC123142221 [Triticum aestivum]XP_044417152.1 uncharacterized protein LOC123142221 [Triticum aestivum]KAF7092238.1 hypothetical protein CFC21_094744 [Triticum aestivum]
MSRSLRRRPAARPSIKALSSYNRWSPLANLAEEEDQSDRLSSLPDGVLLDIVDRLDIADAARTRTLARRWKQIPTMLSRIFITVGSLDNEHKRELTCDDVARANATVLGATRSVLESRTTSLCTINLLCLQFFLGDGTVSIGQIVANTMVTEKVGSAELTLFTMKDTDRCTNDDVLTYGKQFKSFLDACPNAFSGLARLKLENFRLGESPGFPEIFSICKRLEFLRLFNCDMGMLSLLEVSHPLLRELEIVRCYFERVDLKWLPKLTVLTFSLWVSEHDPLSLDYVPLLQTLSITHMARLRHKVLKLSEFLGKATISHLNLNFLCEKIWVKPEEPNQLWQVFHKLRHVTLTHISEECDLNWTMFILQGAPSLQELCIKVWDHLCEMTVNEQERIKYGLSNEKKDAHILWRAPASDFKHRNLSVLRVFGFHGRRRL